MAEKKPLKKTPAASIEPAKSHPEVNMTPVALSSSSSANTGGSAIQAAPPKEKTKAFIAKFFIISILSIIGVLPVVLLLFDRINIDEYKNVVLTLASIFGGPLGIVISGYFKEGVQK